MHAADLYYFQQEVTDLRKETFLGLQIFGWTGGGGNSGKEWVKSFEISRQKIMEKSH